MAAIYEVKCNCLGIYLNACTCVWIYEWIFELLVIHLPCYLRMIMTNITFVMNTGDECCLTLFGSHRYITGIS